MIALIAALWPLHAAEGAEGEVQVVLDGTLGRYEAYAVAHSPSLHAVHARWRARVQRISDTKTVAGPVLSFGYFVRSVETRVGPQRARLGIAQSFPWPTGLRAAADAAADEARAVERRLSARTLQVTRRVAETYWQLWLIRRTQQLHETHVDVLLGLSESARARVATGASSLADQQQIDLTVARIRDQIASLENAEEGAEARLRAVLGTLGRGALETRTAPPESLPVAESESVLREQTLRHPSLQTYRFEARAALARAEVERADRFPSFTVGVDWILTGEAPTDVPDSGKDALLVGGGLRLPLWQRGPREAADAARAEARAQRAEHEAAQLEALASLRENLVAVRDQVRRVALYRDTLIPQAEGVLESVLGAYATGRSEVSAALLAQQDLLDLRIELEQSRARYAQAWAKLEETVGQPVRRGEPRTKGSANPHE